MEKRNHSGSVASGGGLTLCGLLGIVFIVLKLCGVINWSWVWVLCPFWAGTALALSIFIFAVVIIGLIALINRLKN